MKYHMTDCARARSATWKRIADQVRPHNGHYKLPHKDDENDPVVRWMNRGAVFVIALVAVYGFGQQFGYFL